MIAGWTFGARALKSRVECGEIDELHHPARDRRWTDRCSVCIDCRLRQFLSRSELCAISAADFQRHACQDGGARHHALLADGHPDLQEGGRARNLEDEVERRICAAQDLPDVSLVGAARSEEARRRHAGAGRLLLDRAGADEPQFPLLSGVQRRIPERIRPGLWAHRRQCDGARRLFVCRLLLDDRRAGRRHLRDRAQTRSRAASARSSSSPIRST